MRKWTAVFTMLLTYYVAGMFHSSILLTAALMEFFFFFLMFLLSRYLFVHFSVHMNSSEYHTFKGMDTVIQLRCRNYSLFPVSRFRVRLEMRFPDGKKGHPLVFFGSAGPDEECLLECRIAPAHCGILTVTLTQWTVYDYFAWFRKKAQVEETARIFSDPAIGPASVRVPDMAGKEQGGESVSLNLQSVAAGEEIRQIREYHPGDLLRNVHWKISAKMDGLWMKEYRQESVRSIVFGVRLDPPAVWKSDDADCFYEILSSLLQGLLVQNLTIRVQIQNHGAEEQEISVCKSEDLPDVFSGLYQTIPLLDEAAQSGIRSEFQGEDPDLLFDRTLSLFWKGEELCRFSKDHYLEELSCPVPSGKC